MGRASGPSIETGIQGWDLLDRLQRDTFGYFWDFTDPETGLVPDNTREGAPCSIAAVGLALGCYLVAVERGFISRSDAAGRTRATLRTFAHGPRGEGWSEFGHRGFFYHFLDMQTGLRARNSELSTIDTAFLLVGALAAGIYFDLDDPVEDEIRDLADGLYRRADWNWAQNGGPTVTHGWKPESGFLRYRWSGYSEALLLYVLGLGSPNHPLPPESYTAWTETYAWKKLYQLEHLYAGPLFIHQASHVWIDFRGIQDRYMESHGIDYFENSRRATLVQQRYAMRNPRGFRGYGPWAWGVTASDGPGPATRWVDGRKRRFYDYRARSIPWGPDDGTLAPWGAVASLPFAPEIVLPTLEYIHANYGEITSEYGFRCSFNPTFRATDAGNVGWISKGYYGLDQGPIVLMIENHRNGFVWNLMKRCPYVVDGLRRAVFRGGWLDVVHPRA